MPSAKYVRKPLPAFPQVPLSTYRQANLGKISFEHFDGSWESCWTPHRVCYKVCSSTRYGWHREWVPLTLEGDRRTLKGIKTPNRAERQYHSDWTHPSGGISEAHPPHHGSHMHVAQCSALETSKPALLPWPEVQSDLDTGANSAECDRHRDGPWWDHPCPADNAQNRTQLIFGVVLHLLHQWTGKSQWTWQEPLWGNSQRHLDPNVSSMTWTHGQVKERTAFVSDRNYYFWEDNMTFTAPKCGIFAEQSNYWTLLLLLPLALTQNYRVFAIMKNYPINCFKFKP